MCKKMIYRLCKYCPYHCVKLDHRSCTLEEDKCKEEDAYMLDEFMNMSSIEKLCTVTLEKSNNAYYDDTSNVTCTVLGDIFITRNAVCYPILTNQRFNDVCVGLEWEKVVGCYYCEYRVAEIKRGRIIHS